MIKLNLLPPQEKEILASEKIHRWVIFYGSAILGILFIFAALLGVIWIFIGVQLKSVASNLEAIQNSFRGQDLKTQHTAVPNLNKYLEKIHGIQRNQKSYSSFLVALTKIMPEGIRLDSLSVDESNEVILNGYAPKRELVISFKDSLERSNLFENIESPLSNLIKETDINFYFKFKLLPNVLIK